MKILNTYKQGSVTWFEYKHLFGVTKELNIFRDTITGKLSEWLNNPALIIIKRTKDIL